MIQSDEDDSPPQPSTNRNDATKTPMKQTTIPMQETIIVEGSCKKAWLDCDTKQKAMLLLAMLYRLKAPDSRIIADWEAELYSNFASRCSLKPTKDYFGKKFAIVQRILKFPYQRLRHLGIPERRAWLEKNPRTNLS
jgi:hypothetical protein